MVAAVKEPHSIPPRALIADGIAHVAVADKVGVDQKNDYEAAERPRWDMQSSLWTESSSLREHVRRTSGRAFLDQSILGIAVADISCSRN